MIGTDGGLLAAPLRRDYVMLAPAERVDVWVDGVAPEDRGVASVVAEAVRRGAAPT
mgnify:CR=1 FL=1